MMNAEHSPAHLARFGVFDLDLRTGELRKRGLRVHLQEQPFQVLALLVERAGDLVTRDELRNRLWCDEVFVDFDQGLNKAILKIRLALGDSADSPRFVETLERRGYRFIANVDWTDGSRSLGSPAPTRAPDVIVRLVIGDRTVALADGTHVVGRDPAAPVWIDAPVVSREHARVVVAGGEVTVEDTRSRNGTFVNGARIAGGPQPLNDGDALGIGTVTVRVRILSGRTVTA